MLELLISLLETFGYPVKKQGSLLPDEPYPDSFFTFWNNDSSGAAHYSNKETAIIWDYSLNFYSTDPVLVNGKLLEAKALLNANGFTVSGGGYDVASDESTHTGRGINVLYWQNC